MASKSKGTRRKGLGRGLDALLGAPDAAQGTATAGTPAPITELPIDDLEPNRFQPRTHFDETGLEDLAESIRAQGVVQPIVVTPRADDPAHYVIVAGERRWRASRRAGLERVPVVVREVANDQQLLELALVENIQRADLNPIEEAEAYRTLSESFELSQEDIAGRVGKGRTTITNFLRLLRLPEEVQDLLREGRLTAGQARPILSLGDRARQIEVAERAVAEGLTARQLEALAASASESKGESGRQAKTPEEPDVHTREAMTSLTRSLQTRVDIVRKRRGGTVRIHFGSEEELIRLYDRLMAEES